MIEFGSRKDLQALSTLAQVVIYRFQVEQPKKNNWTGDGTIHSLSTRTSQRTYSPIISPTLKGFVDLSTYMTVNHAVINTRHCDRLPLYW